MNLFSKSLFVATLFSFATMAHALSLEEGKKSGAVGEKRSGYLAVVHESADAQKLVTEVNARRRAAYVAIAEKNNSDLTTVEQLGAKEAIQNSPAGTYVEAGDGKWVQKK